MRTLIAALALAGSLAGIAPHASAFEVHDRLRVILGVSTVNPDESATVTPIGGSVSISDEVVPSVQLQYMLNDRWSVNLLCCMARHDVRSTLGIDLGQVSHFPPTLTVTRRWNPRGAVQPYVGAGVNYTMFFDEQLPSGGPVTAIDYQSSIGPALQAGVDIHTGDRWFVNLDARRIWINSDVTLQAGGTVRADVDINPWVLTAGVGYRF